MQLYKVQQFVRISLQGSVDVSFPVLRRPQTPLITKFQTWYLKKGRPLGQK